MESSRFPEQGEGGSTRCDLVERCKEFVERRATDDPGRDAIEDGFSQRRVELVGGIEPRDRRVLEQRAEAGVDAAVVAIRVDVGSSADVATPPGPSLGTAGRGQVRHHLVDLRPVGELDGAGTGDEERWSRVGLLVGEDEEVDVATRADRGAIREPRRREARRGCVRPPGRP